MERLWTGVAARALMLTVNVLVAVLSGTPARGDGAPAATVYCYNGGPNDDGANKGEFDNNAMGYCWLQAGLLNANGSPTTRDPTTGNLVRSITHEVAGRPFLNARGRRIGWRSADGTKVVINLDMEPADRPFEEAWKGVAGGGKLVIYKHGLTGGGAVMLDDSKFFGGFKKVGQAGGTGLDGYRPYELPAHPNGGNVDVDVISCYSTAVAPNSTQSVADSIDEFADVDEVQGYDQLVKGDHVVTAVVSEPVTNASLQAGKAEKISEASGGVNRDPAAYVGPTSIGERINELTRAASTVPARRPNGTPVDVGLTWQITYPPPYAVPAGNSSPTDVRQPQQQGTIENSTGEGGRRSQVRMQSIIDSDEFASSEALQLRIAPVNDFEPPIGMLRASEVIHLTAVDGRTERLVATAAVDYVPGREFAGLQLFARLGNAWQPLQNQLIFQGAIQGSFTVDQLDISNGFYFAAFSTNDGPPPTQCGANWSLVSTGGPPGRTQHAMAYDAQRDEVVLFGGVDCSSGVRNDTWVFNGGGWTQRFPPNPPSPRTVASMAYDPDRGRIVLYGGNGPGPINPLTDTWEWDGVSWGQNVTNHPGQTAHRPLFTAMCPIFTGGQIKMVIPSYHNPPTGTYFGGNWVYDNLTWSNVGAGGFLPRAAYTLAYDSNRNRAIMFGGNRDSTWYNEVWEWSGVGGWAQYNPSYRPEARNQTAMCFDPFRGQAIVFGGYCGATPPTVRDDTWEWDGTSWVNTGALYAFNNPSPRYGHAMVFDTRRRRAVMFGGYANNSPCNGETWVYRYASSPSFSTQPADTMAQAGGSFTLSAQVSSAFPATYQWTRNGQWLQNNGRISGANSPTLTITGADSMMDAGSYQLQAFNQCGYSYSNLASVTITLPPFNLLLPAPGAGGVNPVGNIRFDWTDSAGAQGYNWQIDDTPDMSSPITSFFTSVSEVTPFLMLQPFTTYYWTVDAVSMGMPPTRGTPSVATFTTQGPAPCPFYIYNPAAGQTDVPLNPTFYWFPSCGMVSYTFTLDDAPDFTTPLVTQEAGGATSWSGVTLAYASTYYWRVTAHNAAGEFTAGPQSFTTTAGPLPRTVYESEFNDDKVSANAVEMTELTTLVGNSMGSVPGGGPNSPDYFRLSTPPAAPAIYRNELRLMTAGSLHTAALRGVSQIDGTYNPASDVLIQNAMIVSGGAPARLSAWYTFGRPYSLYYRVQGSPASTADYACTVTTIPVQPVDLGEFAAGAVTFDTSPAFFNTEVMLLDANLVFIPDACNDDPEPDTFQAVLARTLPAGVYYLIIGDFNLASNVPAPPDDASRNGPGTESANILVNNQAASNRPLPFSITDSTGTYAVPALKTLPYEVLFFRFSLGDRPACVADVDDGSGTGTPDGGVTIDDFLFYLFVFENGDLRADVDDGSATGTPDGGVTIDDLLYYLFRFESGC